MASKEPAFGVAADIALTPWFERVWPIRYCLGRSLRDDTCVGRFSVCKNRYTVVVQRILHRKDAY